MILILTSKAFKEETPRIPKEVKEKLIECNGFSSKASKINWESPPPPKPGSFDPDAGDCGQFNPEHFA